MSVCTSLSGHSRDAYQCPIPAHLTRDTTKLHNGTDPSPGRRDDIERCPANDAEDFKKDFAKDCKKDFVDVHNKSQPYPDTSSALETANDLVIGEAFLKDLFQNGASRL